MKISAKVPMNSASRDVESLWYMQDPPSEYQM
jgi:hypothetical protein